MKLQARAALAATSPFAAGIFAALATNLVTADGEITADDLQNWQAWTCGSVSFGFAVLNSVVGFGSPQVLGKMADRYDMLITVTRKRHRLEREEMYQKWVRRIASQKLKNLDNGLDTEQVLKLLRLGPDSDD